MRNRFWLVATLLLALLPITQMASIADASSVDCDQSHPSERCYSILRSVVSNTGIEVHSLVVSGAVWHPSVDFVINTMWTHNDAEWIEAGYGYGSFACGARTTPTWYTARYTNASGYLEACIAGTPSLNTLHTISIQRGSPTSSWYVSLDGATYKTWAAIPTSFTGADTGLETNMWQSALDHAQSHTQRYRTAGGSWSLGWPTLTNLIVSPAWGNLGGFGDWNDGIN